MRQVYLILTSIIILIAGSSQSLYAQNESASLLIKGSLSMPMGDYGESIGEEIYITRRSGFDFGDDVGLARPGAVFSLEIISPINKIKGLGWLVSGRVIINPTEDEELQDRFQNLIKGTGRDTVTFSFEIGNWVHIPLMTGFSYGINVAKDVSTYLTLQGGINISQQPSRKVDAYYIESGITETIEDTEFDVAISYGFSAGVELEFFDKYNISFQYINLGKPEYKGTRTLDPSFFNEIFDIKTNILGDKKSVNMLLLSVGYRIDI
ncbi:MAG: hypothetical protein PVH88_27150 [Ignavibacteria bacterium]